MTPEQERESAPGSLEALDDLAQREREASDPATTPARLRELAALVTSDAQQGGPFEVTLASGSRFPINIIKVLRKHVNLGLNEAKDLYEAAPCVVLRTDLWREALALRDALDAQEATVRVDGPDPLCGQLAYRLARNPSTPPDTLELLAQGRDRVRAAVTLNPSCPRALWFSLGERYPQEFTGNPLLSLLLLEDPSLSSLSPVLALALFDLELTRPMVIPLLRQQASWASLIAEKRLEELDDDEVKLLADHPNNIVRQAVADNIRGTTDAKRRLIVGLLVDKDDEVRLIAVDNPDAPQDVLALLGRAGASEDLMTWSPGNRAPDLSMDEVERLAALGPWGKEVADELRELLPG